LSIVIRLLPNIFFWIVLATVLLIWWNRRRGRAIGLWAVICLALLWLLFTRPVAEGLMWPLESRYDQPTLAELQIREIQTVVVLNGSAVVPRPESLTTSLEPPTPIRFLGGLELCARLGPDCRVVFSGAAGAGRAGLPAFENLSQLAELVAPERQVVSESNSGNTAQHPEQVRPLVGNEPFALVTSAHQMPRAMRSFRRHGMEPVPYPVDFRIHGAYDWMDWAPSIDAAATLQAAVREYLALAFYTVARR
jgi:uncharacterized SAM-binding protein YcdF (DUF218 family)